MTTKLEILAVLFFWLLVLVRRRRPRFEINWEFVLAHRKKAMKRSLDNNLPNNVIQFQARSFRFALERTNSFTRIYLRDLRWYWSVKAMYVWMYVLCAPLRLAGKSHEEAGEIVMERWGKAAEKKARAKARREAKWRTITRR